MSKKETKPKVERYREVSVKIGDIKTEISVRSQIVQELVEKYAELSEIPDITIAQIKGVYYLVDGAHRLRAIKRKIYKQYEDNTLWHEEKFKKDYPEGWDGITIVANLDTRIKTRKQLIVAMVEANVKHGLPYSNSDKILNAKLLQKEGKNHRQIASIFGVDPSTVSRWFKPEKVEKKKLTIEKVLEKKEELESKGEKDLHRKIASDPEIEVSESTVRRIIQKAEEPEGLPAREIQDTTNFDKAKDHLELSLRHMTGLKRILEQYKFNDQQNARLNILLENLIEQATALKI